jgi:hypothetical protein
MLAHVARHAINTLVAEGVGQCNAGERRHSGMRRRDKIARLFFAKGAGPESTLTIVVIDSGLLTSSRPGNDVFPAAFLQAARGRVVIVFLTWFTDR